MPLPRVAFLPDTFTEVNGVAHTARHLEAFARRRQIPLLSVHCGPKKERATDGAVSILQLPRGPARFKLDANLEYDVLLARYAHLIAQEIRSFGAQVIHITGPGDMGAIGLFLSRLLDLPLVISWHTNLHEYAASRLQNKLGFAGSYLSGAAGRVMERVSIEILRHFYRRAEITMAPNLELVNFTRSLTNKPCHPMGRGVDTELFAPARRKRVNNVFRIGYVGRLTPEKNVRFLAELGKALWTKCEANFEFVIVGEGSEENWLRAHVPNALFTGVLRGEALATAYAGMDAFVFPSRTDTFGNVILEALASGVPAVVTNEGGPRFLVQPDVTGYVAASDADFVESVHKLRSDANLRAHMSQAAVAFARQQSWDRVFESVWAVYGEAIVRHTRAAPASRKHAPLLSSRVHGRSSS